MADAERRWVLLRHAPARTRDFARWPDDRARPLRPSGRKEFRQAADALARLLSEEGEVASSPMARSLETADILAKEWPPARRKETWEELSPEGSPSALFARALRSRSRGDLVLVGHEPDLSRFVGFCLTGGDLSVLRFARGGAVALDFPGEVRPGGGRLLWLLTRGQLRKLGARQAKGRARSPGRRARVGDRRARNDEP